MPLVRRPLRCQVVIDANQFFAGAGIDLRELLPEFNGDIAGLFPFPSLGGIIVKGIDINEDTFPSETNGDGIPDILQ